jgi:hypothetical protein
LVSFGVPRDTLVRKLQSAGINAQLAGYGHTTRSYWKVTTDSSICGNHAFEVVSPILRGQRGLDELQTVCRVLKECRARINKSCGLHLHFDAARFSLQQFKNLVNNYHALETKIDRIMPNSRRSTNNNFCQPVSRTINMAGVSTARSVQDLVSLSRTRYGKLNLEAWNRHKTVEFRQHSGTIEFEKISHWLTFLHNLVDYSAHKEINLEGFEAFNDQPTLDYLHHRENDLAA